MLKPFLIVTLIAASFALKCEPDWVQHGPKCFIAFREQKAHNEAEDKCQRLGGHLASIHSKEDIDAVNNLFPGLAWIGGVQVGKSDVFVWTDKTKVDFQYWFDRQPYCKEDFKDNCCVVMAYHWSAYNCDEQHSFVCEKDAL